MIICCGEALIDMLPRTMADGAKVLLPAAGGAPFNTAIALGRLGVPAGFFGGLSSDLFGRQLITHLAESVVDVSLCVRSARPTTLAFVDLESGDARYTFYDEGTAGRMLSEADLPALRSHISALHMGAISLVQEPCGTALEALFRRERGRRVLSLDPNIRPGFIHNEAAFRGRLGRMIPQADIVKLSGEDLEWVADGADRSRTLDDWLAAGVALIIVTAGADGASAYTRSSVVEVAAQPAEIVDTVGAGDSFAAGLLAGLHQQGVLTPAAIAGLEDGRIRRALRLAAAVAAFVVSRAGADPPWRDDLTTDFE